MAHIPTFNGTAQILANKAKFGTHGCYFDGTSGYLTAPDHADWAFSGDFTLECWFYITEIPSANLTLLSQTLSTSNNDSFILDIKKPQCEYEANCIVFCGFG